MKSVKCSYGQIVRCQELGTVQIKITYVDGTVNRRHLCEEHAEDILSVPTRFKIERVK